MASSPPASPLPQRPMSAMVRPGQRSSSRLSMGSKAGGGSRASDDDARTAVKVSVRVRPPLKQTDPGFELIPQRFQRSMVHVTSDTSLAIDSPQGRKLFVFDRVFGEDTQQDGVWDYVSDCVNAFIQGYNVSLLAYGQSGAGKSYTMGTSGPLEQDDVMAMGVIPRAATALFEKLDTSKPPAPKANRNSMSHLRSPRYSASSQSQTQSATERGWGLKATYVEIYNEQLRDLLVPDTVAAAERPPVSIREDVKGNIILTGLRQVDINSIDDLMKALNFGSAIRQTDATAINAKSSRSHAVFSLNLVQRKSGTPGTEKRFSVPLENMTGSEVMVSTDSKLHFVDLAGSERLKNTGAQGERAKEGISINAGLAALGKVISQLSSRQAGSHVSYRDSKLTRLLQDSLGGNAITYMIACVTPAEFHLSETLNTVQYAQRARAIQSKPRIQQVEEGDKQALIDRLKAEVSYLREQIRSAERAGGDRRPAASERSGPSEREVELQNQLLDSQETYTTLSQRHAKLIAEMAKARDNEAAEQAQHESSEDIATERLNRSNSFAQAVEQVVLEYEKTIQSLEQSVSSTRTTLANTEASLLEKETKFAYSETINAQLQSRLQKLMDREANTEHYLHDLESKLDGHTSGEEKNATIVLELRKEIARVKENEAGCEDYISTLEERLAEADQDAELMQREIDRLEQVIERQRSIGKLDSLLYELDNLQQDGRRGSIEPETNGATRRRSSIPHSRTQSHVSRHSHKEAAIPEGEEGEEQEAAALENGDRAATPVGARPDEDAAAGENGLGPAAHISEAQSPAQTRFVGDKLESVTQELVDLRVEHEATVDQYGTLQAKYEEALRNLADMQDLVDEKRRPPRAARDSVISCVSPTTMTRPDSFMSEARSSGKDGRYSSSRSLDSELESALESPATAETSDVETATAKPASQESVVVVDAPEVDAETATVKPETIEAPEPVEARAVDVSDAETATVKPVSDESLAVADTPEAESTITPAIPESPADDLSAELARLKTLAAEKEIAERELADKYSELQSKHGETLDLVEELKTEVSKAKFSEASSPRTSAPVIRRKSSQNVMIIDRAHRSFASLRNLATESFEHQPDMMQNFELNLNTAMHELHSRSERIQELEAEVGAARKEMETKMTIISGLTRERSSLQASPRDMSVVSALRGQLEQSEAQLKVMREAHEEREEELNGEVEALRIALDAKTAEHEAEVEASRAREERIEALQADLVAWEEKHNAALDGVKAADPAQEEKIEKLQADLAAWEEKHQAALDEAKGAGDSEKDDKIAQLQADLTAWEEKHTTALASVQAAGDPLQEEKVIQLQSDLAEWEEKHRAALDGVNAKDAEKGERITQLTADLALWEDKHKAALDSLRTTEETMQRSIGDVEAQLAEAKAKLAESQASAEESRAGAEVEEKHQKMAALLQGELDEYKAMVDSNAAKVAELEAAHAAARSELDEAIKARDETHGHAETQRGLVATLEAKINEYEEAAKTHQEAMRGLHDGHAKELEELKAAEQGGYEEQVGVLMTEHSESVAALEAQLEEARRDLNKVATEVALALGVDTDVERITSRINELIADQKALGEEQKKRAELESSVGELSSINDTVMRDLEAIKSVLDDIVGPSEDASDGASAGVVVRLQGLKRHMEELESGSKKHSRLVEELEEQLAQNFDQAQATTNRLSTLQSERHSQLEEANVAKSKIQAELDTAREEYAALQAKYDELSTTSDPKRSSSMSSQVRKSASVTSLPSPPPAIPLPPLPVGGIPAGAPSSPTSTSRPMSKDNIAAISQIRDDQEARIRTIEKHLGAEKQLTATLEEALSDLEAQSKKVKTDCDAWKRRAQELESELRGAQSELQAAQSRNSGSGAPGAGGGAGAGAGGAGDNRWSLQAVEEERKKRQAAEAARAQLEERMRDISKKKKKKGSLNCF